MPNAAAPHSDSLSSSGVRGVVGGDASIVPSASPARSAVDVGLRCAAAG